MYTLTHDDASFSTDKWDDVCGILSNFPESSLSFEGQLVWGGRDDPDYKNL